MNTLRVFAGGRTHGAPFFVDSDGYNAIHMDPDETLDLTIDWAGWLAGDTISASTFTPTDITEDSESNTTTSATATVTSVNETYGKTVNEIVTAAGRTKRLTIRVYSKVA